MHHDRLARLIADALTRGATRKGVSRVEWDVAGRCMAPVPREIHSRPGAGARDPDDVRVDETLAKLQALFPGAEIERDGRPPDRRRKSEKYIHVRPGTKFPLTLLMYTRCRKCDWCRKQRAKMWSLRARSETAAAARTWFGTLTLKPEAHHTMLSRARVKIAKQGLDYEALSIGEQFTLRHVECSIEITKYLKRIRKESSARFRYLLVAEHHKSGLPHYHVLIHETVSGSIKHRTLSSQWPLGFEKWRVVTDLREATYLCKYLSKATVARVRASVAYGTSEAHSPNGA